MSFVDPFGLPSEDESEAARLRADLTRVTVERDGYRSDIERLVWNLAGCDTIASGLWKPGDYDKTLALPALDSVSRMASELAALRARVADLDELATYREHDIDRLRARVAELDEALHFANGTADLALHHRDIAEQSNAELEATIAEQYAKGYDDSKLEAVKEATALRAQIENWMNGCAYHSNRAEKAEQSNAELVATLREIIEWADEEGADEKYDREIQRLCFVALARAESAAPDVAALLAATPPVTPEMRERLEQAAQAVDAESATPAKHCEDCAPEFGCFDGSEPCCKRPLVRPAPAKHPDTVRLDWLASNKQSGGGAFCLQWSFRDNNNQPNIRAAIDAARKQGGAL